MLGSTATNTNTVNGNNVGTTSNGPLPTSNSLSSATTVATVTSLTKGLQQEHNYLNQNNVPSGDWICFNFGKELYTYSYRGVKKVSTGSEYSQPWINANSASLLSDNSQMTIIV